MSFLELVASERYYGKSRMSGDIYVKRLEEFLLLITIDTGKLLQIKSVYYMSGCFDLYYVFCLYQT